MRSQYITCSSLAVQLWQMHFHFHWTSDISSTVHNTEGFLWWSWNENERHQWQIKSWNVHSHVIYSSFIKNSPLKLISDFISTNSWPKGLLLVKNDPLWQGEISMEVPAVAEIKVLKENGKANALSSHNYSFVALLRYSSVARTFTDLRLARALNS